MIDLQFLRCYYLHWINIIILFNVSTIAKYNSSKSCDPYWIIFDTMKFHGNCLIKFITLTHFTRKILKRQMNLFKTYVCVHKHVRFTMVEHNSGRLVCRSLTAENTSISSSIVSCCIRLYTEQNTPHRAAPSLQMKMNFI